LIGIDETQRELRDYVSKFSRAQVFNSTHHLQVLIQAIITVSITYDRQSSASFLKITKQTFWYSKELKITRLFSSPQFHSFNHKALTKESHNVFPTVMLIVLQWKELLRFMLLTRCVVYK